jgi:hypothetical protein
MAVGLPLKTTYADGDVYSASDVNDTNGTVNLFTSSTLSMAAAKNCLINGAFDNWQRGTSVSIPASSGAFYSTDRFASNTSTNQACTVSRQATSDTINLPFIRYCARFQRNSGQTGTGGSIGLFQSVETANSIPFAGKAVTFSFYARAGANFSAASSLLSAAVFTGTGTDQQILAGFTGQAVPIAINATLTTTWQRFTGTATLSSSATQIAIQLAYLPVGTAGANDYFEATGLQIELGSTATSFTRAGGTIQGELAACQRYYFRSTGSNSYTYHAQGLAASTTICNINVRPPVTMRTTPSGTIEYANLAISDAVATTQAVTAVAWNGTENPNNAVFAFTVASGLTTNRGYWLINNNNANGYIGFSAEL